MINEELAKSVADNLFSREGMNVFAVLDGASIPNLLQTFHQHQPECVCLYRGELESDMASVAPYLVHLQAGTPFVDWLIRNGWGQHWGVYVIAEATLVSMRKHFRKFLTVHDAGGKPLLFRYYDPRVLRVYLPTCNAGELGEMFGPIDSYLLEDEAPGTLLRFRFVAGALDQQKVQLKQE
jgi:hypothetical protein